jgi:8-oxo-dGTP pyrophosphatase MutT (NUDIX family)
MEKRFHLLARAVVVDNGRVLLVRQKGIGDPFLPGGHIEFGESAPKSLLREIKEELGVEADVGQFLGAVEHCWTYRGEKNFEVNLCFKATLTDISSEKAPCSQECHLEFFWQPISELAAANPMPPPVVELITNFAAGDPSAWWASTLNDIIKR